MFDAADGRPLLEITIKDVGIGDWVIEPDGHLLFEVSDGQRATLVRCTLTGECERATGGIPSEKRVVTTLTLPGNGY